MSHDIFISYSSKDKQTADAICHELEANKLKCWIAPRNIIAGKNYAEQIMTGIKKAKIVVLVFSKNSQESVFVNNEIDNAFSNNKPIISFKIDETLPENKMEFFLKNKHWLDAYPNPESVFETLVNDAHLLCEDSDDDDDVVEIEEEIEEEIPVDEPSALEEKLKQDNEIVVDVVEFDEDPTLPAEEVVEEPEEISTPVKEEPVEIVNSTTGSINEDEPTEIVKSNTIPSKNESNDSSGGGTNYTLPIIGIAVLLIAVIGFLVLGGGIGSDTSSSSAMDVVVDYIDMDDDSGGSYSTDYAYVVFGNVTNQNENTSNYVVHVDFMDDSGKVVKTNDTKLKNIKSNILGVALVNKNNIEKVSIELKDDDGNVISTTESDNIVK